MAKKQFKAESKRLLDLMINSIYTHQEIFLREIISNASDAIDKLCYLSLTDENVGLKREDFAITLSIDKENRTLTVSDNGIGMDADELENNLGVIASSGTFQFRQELDKEAEADVIGQCDVTPTPKGADITALSVLPQWRRKGYGSYLLKEILRRFGGYDREAATVFTAPLPADEGEGLFWQKFGFAPEDGRLVRRRTPDLTAVRFVQDYLAAHLPHPKLCIDATCGNGGDTAFLCRLVGPEGRVLGFDIQPEAITSTRARLEKQGLTAELICDSHANLLQYVRPGTADIVMFNFGWLPGADHSVFSTADSSIPALEAALAALRAGGVLSAILYSGRVIGTDEKQSILGWLRALPLEKYTVLVCDFANWADTAPLPCLVLKK